MGECQQQKYTQHAQSTKTECDYLNGWIKNGHILKNFTQNGESQRYSWGTQKKKKRQICLNSFTCSTLLMGLPVLALTLKIKVSGTQKSHPKVVNPRDIAGERKKKKKKKCPAG